MLLVHGYRGAYDAVSRNVATYVRSLGVNRPPKPLYGCWRPEPPSDGGGITQPSGETLQVLHRRGYLTSMTVQEEEKFFEKVVGILHKMNMGEATDHAGITAAASS